MKRATQEWVGKAEDDHRAARLLAEGHEHLYDQICFLCQQSAEKYLKAMLEELGLSVPKTHDLDKLLTALLPFYPTLRSLRRGVVFLTNFAVGTRYPGDNATKRQAMSALRWSSRVREALRPILGI